MKRLFLIIPFMAMILSLSQAQGVRTTDKSPMDMAYYPDNFAHDRKPGDEALIRVTYSRPAINNRVIFGELVPYGKVWRTGANESTEIKIYKDIMVGDKSLQAGTYSLFTIPGENEWIIIFNSQVDHWGAYSYDETRDVLRVTVPALKTETTINDFLVKFEKKGNVTAEMKMGWENSIVAVPLKW